MSLCTKFNLLLKKKVPYLQNLLSDKSEIFQAYYSFKLHMKNHTDRLLFSKLATK